jgi:hypothetical protein
MRTSVPMHSGIEVSGRVIPAALEAFGEFTVLAGQMLMANGVGRPDRNGFIRVDTDAWYPLDGYLKTYKEIEEQLGTQLIRKLGMAYGRYALAPPTIVDITTAMQAMDVAFHMNHRQHGRIMFDGITGVMLEGIGHYHSSHAVGQRRIVMRCDNPYPCTFDQALLESRARRYSPGALVEHESPSTCRKKGSTLCSYLVTW